MILGDIILKYRNSFTPKISQRDFGKRCDLSHTYIAALEKNIDPRTGKPIAPTLDAIKKIANGMNISIEDILKMLDDEQEFKMNEEAPQYQELYDETSDNILKVAEDSETYYYTSPQFYMCPVYGRISAGQPNWAEECIEGRIPVPMTGEIDDPENCFYLKVNGESMNLIIKNGAYALIHKQDTVEDGEIAVVLVNGYDATLKKFSKQGELVMLEPMSNVTDDPDIKTQIYDKKTSIKILGKYLGKFELN